MSRQDVAAVVCMGLAWALAGWAAEPPAAPANATLAAKLDAPCDVRFVRAFPSEVLRDLSQQKVLPCVYGPLNATCLFSWEPGAGTVRNLVEKLAAEAHLDLQCRDDKLVVWRVAPDEVLAGLEKQLVAPEVQTRCEAVWKLTRLGDPRAYPRIFKALSDPEPAVVYWAIKGLSESHGGVLRYAEGREAAAEALGRLAEQRTYLREVLPLLGQLHHPLALAPIKAAVKAANFMSRSTALMALAEDGSDEALGFLLTELAAPDRGQRHSLITYLGRFRQPRALEALLKLADDADATVLSGLTSSLEMHDDPRATEGLWKLASRSLQANERRQVLCALVNRKEARAVEPLVAELRKGDSFGASMISSALAGCGDPKGAQAVLAAAEDTAFAGRRWLAQPLSRLSDPKGIEVLIQWAGGADTQLAEAARAALCGVGSKNAQVSAYVRKAAQEPGSPMRKSLLQVSFFGRSDLDPETLLAWLKAETTSEGRKLIYGGLAATRAPQALEALLAAAASEDPQTRAAVAPSLVRCTFDPRAQDALLKLLDDPEVRTQALTAVGSVFLMNDAPGEKVEARVVALAADADAKVRAEAAKAMRLFRGPAFVPTLQKLCDDPVAAVRLAAFGSVYNFQDPRLVPTLVRLTQDTDKDVARQAGNNLGWFRAPGMDAALKGLLDSPDPNVLAAALRGLEATHDPALVPPLTRLVKSTDPSVSQTAMRRLAEMRLPAATDALLELWRTGGRNNRLMLVRNLFSTQDPRVPKLMLEALKTETERFVKNSIAQGLAEWKGEGAYEAILAAFEAAAAEDKNYLGETLARLDGARAFDMLKARFDSAQGDAKGGAARALAMTADLRAVDLLLEALKQAPAGQQTQIASALGLTRSPKAVGPLTKLLQEQQDPAKGWGLSTALTQLLSSCQSPEHEAAQKVLDEWRAKSARARPTPVTPVRPPPPPDDGGF